MRIIITATLIYLIIQLIRFLFRIKINRSNMDARESLYQNMDIQDADYEDINRDNS